MYLFNYTKGYFEAWVKLLISFMLQPMVAIVFMTTMLSVYDFGFYGSCKYSYQELTFSGANMDMSNLSGDLGTYSAGPNGGRAVRYYYVNDDWSAYTPDEQTSCANSLGFILNNPLAWLLSTTTSEVGSVDMPWINDPTGTINAQRFSFLNAIQDSPGMFFDMIEVLYDKIKTLALSLLTACFTLYLMQHFSETLAEFAADMTEGVSLGNMSIKPQTLYKAGMAALSAAGNAAKSAKDAGSGATDKASTGRKGASDKLSSNGESRQTSDKFSTGGGEQEAGDKVSTGDGGSIRDKVSSEDDRAEEQPQSLAVSNFPQEVLAPEESENNNAPAPNPEPKVPAKPEAGGENE